MVDLSGMSRRKQMQVLREQGLKYKEIGERLGVSAQYVSAVCAKNTPGHFVYVGKECPYPNLRNWMNKNKISRREILRQMGLTTHTNNYNRLTAVIRGDTEPRKAYIDKMLEVTGLIHTKNCSIRRNKMSAILICILIGLAIWTWREDNG